ncbi:hypothetical protein FQN54_000029 [Arachnomyces sp. PD_36]|nr:hypothetical protein FQN54_000029 [Arachnomyces sp. PD_36]
MADSVPASEQMTIEENGGGVEYGSDEGGLQHIYFFIPSASTSPSPTLPDTNTVTAPTPAITVTGDEDDYDEEEYNTEDDYDESDDEDDATQEIQAGEMDEFLSYIAPPHGSPLLLLEQTEAGNAGSGSDDDDDNEDETITQDSFNYTIITSNPHPIIQGEPFSQKAGSIQHVYFFIPTSTTTTTTTAQAKDTKYDPSAFEIPTIVITAASEAASKAGTDDGAETITATETQTEAVSEVKDGDEGTASAEQTHTQTGTDSAPEHVTKKIKTDITDGAHPSPHGANPHHHRKHHKNRRYSSRSPSGSRSGSHSPNPSIQSPTTFHGDGNEKIYTSPNGQAFTRKELFDLERGVRDENGDMVFFKPSFIEDPWAAAGDLEAKKRAEVEVKIVEGDGGDVVQ